MTSLADRAQGRTLEQWLEYLEQCHPSNIELGLDRIGQVASRLPIDLKDSRIITVAGTNGKGSTVTMLAAILEQGGYKTACYTSPHILDYNERVRLGDRLATDAELCDSFAAVEAVRGEIQLTYFEFGTLAALQIFSVYQPDFILLEVGLGGRLDAVNILDPDIAIVTNVALDHTEWLGDTREAIGREKAGIFRSKTPALIGEKDIPATVLEHAAAIDAEVYANGAAFQADMQGRDRWRWSGRTAGGESLVLDQLPVNDFPLDNCATVVQAIALAAPQIGPDAIAAGLAASTLAGRLQQIDRGHCLVLDVAHNPHAAGRLVEQVRAHFPGRPVHLVLAMLADKNYREVLEKLRDLEPRWYVAGIQEERGLEAKILYNSLCETGEVDGRCFTTIGEAFTAAEQAIGAQGGGGDEAVLLVTGSFFTVSAVLELL